MLTQIEALETSLRDRFQFIFQDILNFSQTKLKLQSFNTNCFDEIISQSN